MQNIKSITRALPAVLALALSSVQAAEDYSTWTSYKNVVVNTKATGAAVGANVGSASDGLVYSQDVQRCEYVPTSGPPDYWDVTYVFAGREHRAQMTAPPGAIILVNAQGEPRV